jgi:hypothetical protein
MPYPKSADPAIVQMVIRIPETLHTDLHALLVNPRSGRVPHGKWQATITSIIREYVDRQRITIRRSDDDAAA